MYLVKRASLALMSLVLLAGFVAWLTLWYRPLTVNGYINKFTLQFLLSSPELLTYMGAIENTPLDFHSGKLGSYTREQDEKTLQLLRNARQELDHYGPEGLQGQALISWRVAEWTIDDLLTKAALQPFGYRINPLKGPLIQIPEMLTGSHQISSAKSVRRYLSRLQEFGRVLSELSARIEEDRQVGIIPPDFMIVKILTGMNTFIDGAASDNVLVTSLVRRMQEAAFSEQEIARFATQAAEHVDAYVRPGYENMMAQFEELLAITDHDAGIWRLPNGEAIYAAALRSNTTTDLTPEELHQTGLSEIARIQAEMDVLLRSQGLSEGTVAERMGMLSERPENLFRNDEQGRQAMIAYLEELDAALMKDIGDYFDTLPTQPLEILRVPDYAEASSTTGYYRPPPLDGSRGGRFYINQRNTAEIPRFALPTLMYHEGSPGHHFQGALAISLEGIPLMRRFPTFPAFAEGWALYSERVVAEDIGVYADDPLGNLGRLQLELFRATRLAVDTGLHAKRWSREQAIDYMKSNTGLPDGRVEREIERYAADPGQATSYKTGQLAMLKMRARAEAALGENFDLGAFHDVMLLNGALPLGILNDLVDAWIDTSQREDASDSAG